MNDYREILCLKAREPVKGVSLSAAIQTRGRDPLSLANDNVPDSSNAAVLISLVIFHP